MRGSLTPAELSRKITAVLDGSYGGCAALATVIERGGSAPQITGAKLLLRDDAQIFGTVGGGAIEAKVLEACERALRFGRSERVNANLVRDLGMCCGGSMEIFVEHLQSPARLFVLGAGHVSQALAPLAASVGFELTVLDDRDELLEHENFAGIVTGSYDADELDTGIENLGPRDYVIIVTRDHQRDEAALSHLLERPCAYLGMIGSRRKVHTVLARVLRRYDERERPRPELAHVHAPIGLALGGRSPMEIAVSIVAELVAHRRGGSGAPMSIVSEVLAGLAPEASPQPASEPASKAASS